MHCDSTSELACRIELSRMTWTRFTFVDLLLFVAREGNECDQVGPEIRQARRERKASIADLRIREIARELFSCPSSLYLFINIIVVVIVESLDVAPK